MGQALQEHHHTRNTGTPTKTASAHCRNFGQQSSLQLCSYSIAVGHIAIATVPRDKNKPLGPQGHAALKSSKPLVHRDRPPQ